MTTTGGNDNTTINSSSPLSKQKQLQTLYLPRHVDVIYSPPSVVCACARAVRFCNLSLLIFCSSFLGSTKHTKITTPSSPSPPPF